MEIMLLLCNVRNSTTKYHRVIQSNMYTDATGTITCAQFWSYIEILTDDATWDDVFHSLSNTMNLMFLLCIMLNFIMNDIISTGKHALFNDATFMKFSVSLIPRH